MLSATFAQQLSTLVDMSQLADRAPTHPHELQLAFSNYQTYTEDILLSIATATLQGVDSTSLPASSSIAYEIGNDGSVRAYLNDVEYTPVGCT